MSKIFHCTNCDAQFSAWQGRCDTCGKWNTLEEENSEIELDRPVAKGGSKKSKPRTVSQVLKPEGIKSSITTRLGTGFKEFDRTLGGGFVTASFVLLGGEPGVGKSTLILQVVDKLVKKNHVINHVKNHVILYASGEESTEQISLRASRLKLELGGVDLVQANNLEDILSLISKNKYKFLVIDSIQTLYSEEATGAAGSISQVRYCADKLMAYAKGSNLTVLVIGHVTKEGVVAGPKTLEHLVDVVLYLEGDKNRDIRILRSSKNRFGATNEIGIWQMKGSGFREVSNPSELFLSDQKSIRPGTVVSALIEGQRPILVEVQALTSTTSFGYPRRAASGFSLARLNMIIAILTKHLRLRLNQQDVYVNLVGGLKSREPALDLAVALAIVSAYKNKKLLSGLVVIGELGLTGEIRAVSEEQRRVKEANRLGFKKVISSTNSKEIGGVVGRLF